MAFFILVLSLFKLESLYFVHVQVEMVCGNFTVENNRLKQ